MTDAGRFERGEQYSAVRGVVTHRGLDPITGLDVLIYEFAGEPTMVAGPAVSDHLLKVLAADRLDGPEGVRGRLVVAYPSGATLLAPGESAIDDAFVLQALAGLKDAQVRGLTHGDINAGRLLYSLGEVSIEGYGVPWAGQGAPADAARQKAALRADVVGLAKALLSLAGTNLSAEVGAALRAAASDSANPPMTAERLHAIVTRLAGGAVKVPASGFTDLTLPTVPVKRSEEQAARPAKASAEPAVASAPRRPERTESRPPPPVAPARPPADDPEPITVVSDPGLTPRGQPSPRDSSPGFVKALPPGAKYRHGNPDEGPRPAPIRMDRNEATRGAPRRTWRGPALLLLILLVAGLGAYLAFLNQNSEDGSSVSPFVTYQVDVSVLPGNLPPVQLVVVQSPPDSRYSPGATIGAVPQRLPFDAAGTWVVYGRFLARETPPVTLEVPQDRAITVVFPDEDE